MRDWLLDHLRWFTERERSLLLCLAGLLQGLAVGPEPGQFVCLFIGGVCLIAACTE